VRQPFYRVVLPLQSPFPALCRVASVCRQAAIANRWELRRAIGPLFPSAVIGPTPKMLAQDRMVQAKSSLIDMITVTAVALSQG
jgi:hypothetical protein